MADAACAESPPSWFDPPSFTDEDPARVVSDERRGAAVCARCPVAAMCAATAMSNRLSGLWGGLLFTADGDRPVDLVAHLGDSAWWSKYRASRLRAQVRRSHDVTMGMVLVRVPGCGKVDCQRQDRHIHTGEIQAGERIVVTPRLQTAPSWAYGNPHGVFVSFDGVYSRVILDDGTAHGVSPGNVVRERLWQEPPLPERKVPKPLHRPIKPLDVGPWDEPTLPDAS
jgi:hypothetical protein